MVAYTLLSVDDGLLICTALVREVAGRFTTLFAVCGFRGTSPPSPMLVVLLPLLLLCSPYIGILVMDVVKTSSSLRSTFGGPKVRAHSPEMGLRQP